MDSGNSGSLQSSSGGDDEYDSRAEALHPFLHSSSSAAAAVLPPPQPPPPPPLPPLFDPLSYLTSFPRSSPSPLLSPALTAAAPPAPPPSDPPQQPPRGSKKRSRASRRAPTTVLTTDTSNFRAMVQEFTGIPSPPFAAASSSAASHFPRPRLDLSAPPPYLLRPFPQKLQSQSLPLNPITPPSTLLFSSNSNTNTSCSNTSSSRSSSNYQLPCDTGLGSHPQTLMPMQNPTFPFQSLRLSAALPAFVSAPPSISLSQSELGGDLQSLVGWAGDRRADLRPELHAEKGTESATAAAKGESAVDSWICSSD